MIYKLYLTLEDNELLTTIDIDTDDQNWGTDITKRLIIEEVFEEINRYQENKL